MKITITVDLNREVIQHIIDGATELAFDTDGEPIRGISVPEDFEDFKKRYKKDAKFRKQIDKFVQWNCEWGICRNNDEFINCIMDEDWNKIFKRS